MRHRWAMALAAGLLLAVAGCGSDKASTAKAGAVSGEPVAAATPDEPASNSGSTAVEAPAETPDDTLSAGAPKAAAAGAAPPKAAPAKGPHADLVGRWKGEIALPEGDANDPNAQMARGMAQMLAGRLSLEIKPDLAFSLSMMVPIEGKVKRQGRALTFVPEKVMGMTPEEAQKMGPQGGPSVDEMTATLSADGKQLVFEDKKAPASGKMIFTRAPAESEIARKSTVTAAEKGYVGEWKGTMSGAPEGLSAEQKQQMDRARKALNSVLALTLRRDNTFSMKMMMDLEGKWKVENGKVRLDVEGLLGMGQGSASANEPILLAPGANGTLSASQNGQTLTFRR